jgi:hypothetical protein
MGQICAFKFKSRNKMRNKTILVFNCYQITCKIREIGIFSLKKIKKILRGLLNHSILNIVVGESKVFYQKTNLFYPLSIFAEKHK